MMEFHRLCLLVPDYTEAQHATLLAEMKADGQREQIITYEGKILDGRNRYRVLRELGYKDDAIRFAEWRPRHAEDTPQRFVKGKLPIREMTGAQRVATALLIDADGLPVAPVGRPKKGNQADSAQLPETTVRQRAEANNVSVTTQKEGERMARADPSISADVAANRITASEGLAKARAVERGEKATLAPAPAPGPVKALKLTEVQRLKKRIADLEGELLLEQQAHQATRDDLKRVVEGAVEQDETVVALQAFRDNEHVVVIKKLQEQLRISEAGRDSGDRTREVMQAEIKRLQRIESKWQKAQDAAKKK